MVTSFAISGMTCGGCVKHVDAALRGVPGVSAVEVSLAEHRAKVVHDPAKAPVATLVAAVGEAGYEAVTDPPAGA